MTMTTDIHAARAAKAKRRISIARTLLIWNHAYREHRQMMRLSPEALADMDLTEADRATVTVAGIAARMRARA